MTLAASRQSNGGTQDGGDNENAFHDLSPQDLKAQSLLHLAFGAGEDQAGEREAAAIAGAMVRKCHYGGHGVRPKVARASNIVPVCRNAKAFKPGRSRGNTIVILNGRDRDLFEDW